MPFETASFPFEPGDDDMADFMLERWLPFARDDCNWEDNDAPALGSHPDYELWMHRGTTASPVSPFVFFRCKADSLQIFTGDGVDTGQEIYDQPNNPANAPLNTSFDFPTSGSMGPSARMACINSAPGPYSAYWLFSDTTGEYFHCVLKVNSRQYRHFHVGRLKQVDGGPDLDPTSFYVTGHFWGSLDPNPVNYPISPNANEELAPYAGVAHRIPFRNVIGVQANGAFGGAMPNTIPPSWFYMPGLYPIQVSAAAVNAGGTGHAVDDIITVALTDGVYAGAGTAATLRVTAVSGGVITGVSVETPGDYDRQPGDGNTNPVTGIAQASTTGSGIDATFDLTFIGYKFFQASQNDGLQVISSPAQKSNDGSVTTAVGDVMIRSRIGAAQTNYYDQGMGTVLFAADANYTANSNVLVPIYVAAAFDFQSDTRYGIVAQVPDVFRVNMRDYAPEQEITVGGETYVVFPVINSDSVNTVAGEGYSGYEGLAYRKETGVVV